MTSLGFPQSPFSHFARFAYILTEYPRFLQNVRFHPFWRQHAPNNPNSDVCSEILTKRQNAYKHKTIYMRHTTVHIGAHFQKVQHICCLLAEGLQHNRDRIEQHISPSTHHQTVHTQQQQELHIISNKQPYHQNQQSTHPHSIPHCTLSTHSKKQNT